MSRVINHASQFDPLRTETDLSNVRPYYEDRILVRWVPPQQPETGAGIVAPNRPSPRDEGPQQGIVVAVGRGNTGLSSVVRGPENQPVIKHKPFRPAQRVEPTVKPGDRVLYSRVVDQEFEHEGVLHTFLYEEQHVLG